MFDIGTGSTMHDILKLYMLTIFDSEIALVQENNL